MYVPYQVPGPDFQPQLQIPTLLQALGSSSDASGNFLKFLEFSSLCLSTYLLSTLHLLVTWLLNMTDLGVYITQGVTLPFWWANLRSIFQFSFSLIFLLHFCPENYISACFKIFYYFLIQVSMLVSDFLPLVLCTLPSVWALPQHLPSNATLGAQGSSQHTLSR